MNANWLEVMGPLIWAPVSLDWFQIVVSLIWAIAIGVCVASGFVWRLQRHEAAETKRFLDGLRKAQEGRQ